MCSLLLILSQLLLSACGTLHKTTKSSSVSNLKDKEEIEFKDQSKYLHQQENKSLTIRNDAADSFSQIEIWPKGRFDFSPGEGFSGQAEKVLIYKKTKSGSRTIERKEEAAQSTKVSDITESRIKTKDISLKDTEKKDLRLSVWHWLLILVALLFLWYILKYKLFIHP
ncbi:hypothetical protein [Pedobacter caeni]|nr:hypothetical protein [Pedobacter caeni]